MGSVKADAAYVPHGDGERDEAYSFHVCACFNGTTAGDTPMPLHPAAEGERAAVVAFVRARMYDGELRSDEAVVRALQYLVVEIERGAHRREEKE
jgi:hypothetical protein